MKALSAEAAGLVEHLFSSHRAGGASADAAIVSCLHQLARRREPRVVTLLLPLLASPQWRTEASSAIEILLRNVSPTDLAALDQQARAFSFTVTHGSPVELWDRLSPAEAEGIAAALDGRPATIGMLTMHRNGFVRQIALLALDRCHDGREIPYLTLRANDWVGEVAELAFALLQSRLVADNQAPVRQALPFLMRLDSQRRRDHQLLLTRIHDAISGKTPADAGRALAALRALPLTARRYAYDALWRRWRLQEVLLAALADPDLSCRLRAIRWLATDVNAEEAAALTRVATSDCAPTVRARALAVLAERSGDDALPLIPAALLDAAASVRSVARYFARALESPISLRDLYLQHLSDANLRTRAAAIEGLSEIGARDQLDSMLPLLESSSARLRAAALRAITRLDTARGVEAAMTMIERGGGGSAALRVVAAHPREADFGRIATVQRTSDRPWLRTRLLRLLARAPKWDVPVLLVAAAEDGDRETQTRAWTLLGDWIAAFNNTQTAPTPLQRRALRALLDDHAAAIPEPLRREFQFALSAFD